MGLLTHIFNQLTELQLLKAISHCKLLLNN